MAREKRLIDANELANFFGFMRKMWSGSEIMNVIREADAVDAVEVVHGQWELEDCDIFHCSVCGYVDTFPHMDDGVRPHKYCPACGAKMDGGVDNGI